MHYLNCNSTILDNIDAARLIMKQYNALKRRCGKVEDKETDDVKHFPVTRNCCFSVDSCETCVHYHLVHPHSVRACKFLQMPLIEMPVVSKSCVELTNSYNTAEFYTNCCGFGNQNVTAPTMLFPSAHKESHHSILHHFIKDDYVSEDGMRKLCKRLKFSKTNIDDTWLHDIMHNTELSGLGCKTNLTVRFYAMDLSSSYGSAFLANFVGDESDKELPHLKGFRDTVSAVILNLAVILFHMIPCIYPVNKQDLS